MQQKSVIYWVTFIMKLNPTFITKNYNGTSKSFSIFHCWFLWAVFQFFITDLTSWNLKSDSDVKLENISNEIAIQSIFAMHKIKRVSFAR